MRYKHKTFTKIILKYGIIIFLFNNITLYIWAMEAAELTDCRVQVEKPQNRAFARGLALAEVWTQVQ
jgi:hypothetical protein